MSNIHTNTLSPIHHSVKMWVPQATSDAAAICLKLAKNYMQDSFQTGAGLHTTRIVSNLLDGATSQNMAYTWGCLTHAEYWMNKTDNSTLAIELNSLFPELCNNRTTIID